jgi:hypothetical protein
MLMAQLDDLKAAQADVNSKIDALNAKVDAFMAGLPTPVDLTDVIAAEGAQGTAVDAVAAKIPA